MKIGEMFVQLGVDLSQRDLGGVQKFDKSIKNTAISFGKIVAIASATVFAIDRIVASTTKGVVAMSNFGAQTGLSIDKLQEWQVAGQLSNLAISAEQITGSLSNLQRNLTAIRLGGGDVSGFNLLGINVAGKEAFQVLEEVRESIKGLDDATATNIIQRLGLDPQFIVLLRQSKEEFQAFNKEFLLSGKQRETLLLAAKDIKALKLEFQLLKDQFVVSVTPALKGFIQLLRSFVERPSTQIFLFGIAEAFKFITQNVEALKWALIGIVAFINPVAGGILALIELTSKLLDYLTEIGLIDFSNFKNFKGGLLGQANQPALGLELAIAGMNPASSNVTTVNQTNNYDINSSAEAPQIAQEIQYINNDVLSQFNNGALA